MAHFNATKADSIRQQNGEFLKDYVAQFKVTMLEIYHLDESVAMLGLKKGLRTSRFTYSLDKTYPKSYLEMMTRMQNMDEGALTQQETNGKTKKKQA